MANISTHLIVVDVVTRPAISVRKERDSSTQSQTTNANSRDSTSNDSQAHGCELGVDVVPHISGTNCGLLFIRRHGNLVQISQVNCQAALDVGSTSKCSMATALDGELALSDSRCQHRQRHIFGRGWRKSTGRMCEGLLLRPVSRLLKLISRAIGIRNLSRVAES